MMAASTWRQVERESCTCGSPTSGKAIAMRLKEEAPPKGDAVISSLRSGRARELATLLADHRRDGVVPDFGHADSPAEVRALRRRPAPPGCSHFLNGDARRLLSPPRLASSCQQRHAPLQDRLPHPLGMECGLVLDQDDRRLDVLYVRTAVHRRRGQARDPLVEIDFGSSE